MQQILEREGYLHLRALEQQVLLAIEPGGAIIATGGSVVYSATSMARLKAAGPVVYLEADLATLQQRFGSRAVAEQLRDSLLRASEDDLAAVQRALQAGDRETAALHLHRQAGGLGAVGAKALAAQANTLVERLQDATGADTAPLFVEVAEFVAQLQHQLQRLAH